MRHHSWPESGADRLGETLGRAEHSAGYALAGGLTLHARRLSAHTVELIGESDDDGNLFALFGADDVCELVWVGRGLSMDCRCLRSTVQGKLCG